MQWLLDRAREVTELAHATSDRSARLRAALRAEFVTARRLRIRAQQLHRHVARGRDERLDDRNRTRGAEIGDWLVQGFLDGEPVEARWRNGGLQCDWEVFQRAELLVALGEEFFLSGEVEPRFSATVTGDPTAVMLTAIRALDRVTAVEMYPSPTPDTPNRGVRSAPTGATQSRAGRGAG